VAHFRKPLAAAAALNTVIFAVEALAGFQSQSLSLLMDSVHNFSDELALVCLYLAFVLPVGVSRNFLRSANVFNSIGILAVSALLLWQAIARFLQPVPVSGTIPIVIGVLAAIGNWGVARFLKEPARDNPAIRLAYIHNLGDIQVSLAPVLSGILVVATGLSYFDSIIAGLIALWIIWATLREVIGSHEELIWPEKVSCGHADEV
jgi:Co/Zn/Cd efflux system component